MSQTKIIALVVGLLVVGGGGYMLLGSDRNASQNEMDSDSQETSESSGKKMAFSQFLKQGGAYKCTVHQNINDTDTHGVTYINNGMVKGEYETNIDAGGQSMSMTAYVVVRDGYTYSWTSFAPDMGFKAKVVESAPSSGSQETSGNYSFNADDVGDYECESWSADASVFALPSGVTFTEVN